MLRSSTSAWLYNRKAGLSMRLLITDTRTEDVPFDVIPMTASEFNLKSTQPFIASSNFDAVVLDLNAKVDAKILTLLMSITRVVPRKTDDALQYNGVSSLCVLYPERAAELRVYFMRDKEKLVELVNELSETFEWENC